MEERSKEAKLVRRIVFFIILAIAVIFAVIVGGGYYYVHSALEPADPGSTKKVDVDIPLGSSVSEIAQSLHQKGIIKNALVFRYYVKYKNENGFQAGHYEFSPSMSIDEIIDKMQKGQVAVALKLQFPEGLSITRIADIIAKHTNLDKQDILKKMRDRTYIKNTFMKDDPFLQKAILDLDIRYPLEGYLFPATYTFNEKNPKLETIIRKMLHKNAAVLKEFEPQIKRSKMSTHQILTLASMIEAEGAEKDTQAKISSVFYNRLDKKMRLQSDPTVDYAVNKHSANQTKKALNTDSPYNTYRYKGLPPGPIANPGKGAIQAALNPAETDYLYFYARFKGNVIFSRTYEQHKQVVQKYGNEWEEYIKKQKNKK
jgi:UPF0755 protein